MSSSVRNPACLLAMAVLVAANASALDRRLVFQSNAAGVCQAALPAFEGLIRKRPMAIQNEGGSAAFVTCSPVTLQHANTVAGHGIYLVNNTSAVVTINCSAVIGARTGIAELTIPRSRIVQANDSSSIYWTIGDFDPDNSVSFNTTCALPPGTGISTLYTSQNLDVGN